jgi:hypothetical protein
MVLQRHPGKAIGLAIQLCAGSSSPIWDFGAVGVCRMLLAQCEAEAMVVEQPSLTRPRDAYHPPLVAGRRGLSFNLCSDPGWALLSRRIAKSGIVIMSSDIGPAGLQIVDKHPCNIVRDIIPRGRSHLDGAERLRVRLCQPDRGYSPNTC